MSEAIRFDGVVKRFGSTRALDGASFVIPEGVVAAFIGPNGAGKTTAFSVLGGFLRPDAGRVHVRGQPLRAGTPPVGRIALLPQDASMPPRMRAIDALSQLGRLSGLPGAEAKARARRALERLGLGAEAEKRIQALSHGQRRRVGVASTLLGSTEVIVLDEPSAGLDPRAAAELRALIKELGKERTVVVSSHNLAELESTCDHAVFLSKGRVVLAGSMSEVKRQKSEVFVRTGRGAADPRALAARLSGIAGVHAAEEGEGGWSIRVDDEVADRATTEALTAIIEAGAWIQTVERGQSLEQRFLETTE